MVEGSQERGKVAGRGGAYEKQVPPVVPTKKKGSIFNRLRGTTSGSYSEGDGDSKR